MRISPVGLLLVFILAFTPGVARAANIIVGLSGYDDSAFLENPAVLGFSFDVSAAGMIVTQLGVYDHNGDGLISSHQVGLWDSSGTLLASGTVASGTTSPLDANGYFRTVDIPYLWVPPGTGYQVGAYYASVGPGTDADILGSYTSSQTTVDPLISFVHSRIVENSGFVAPTADTLGSNRLFGASFNTIPEPTTLALLLSGSLAVGAVAFRRRNPRDS